MDTKINIKETCNALKKVYTVPLISDEEFSVNWLTP